MILVYPAVSKYNGLSITQISFTQFRLILLLASSSITFPRANSKDAEQTVQMHRLVCVFVCANETHRAS